MVMAFQGNPIFAPLVAQATANKQIYPGVTNRVLPISAPIHPILSPPIGMPVRLPVSTIPVQGTIAQAPASLNNPPAAAAPTAPAAPAAPPTASAPATAPLPTGSSPAVPGPVAAPIQTGAILSSGNNVPGSLSPSLSGTASAPSTGFGSFFTASSPVGGIPWLLLAVGALVVILLVRR